MATEQALDQAVKIDNKMYYPVTDIQRYWLDDNIDREYKRQNPRHGVGVETFEIRGGFDANILRRAVSYTVQRHESLRCTFHEWNGQFFMNVWDEHPEVFEFMDLTGVEIKDNDAIEEFVNFVGHSFNLKTSPPFAVRLVQIEKNRFILSRKIHHVIFDDWSQAILLGDLYAAYEAFDQQREPDLVPLIAQYKDCLAFLNEMTQANAESDKAYWNSMYDCLPPELTIPGVNNTIRKEGFSERANFTFSDDLSAKLATFTRRFSTSMFVILQATFKAYLFCRTGQKDMVIGTPVYGRGWPEFADQIGCYAKTMTIRTVFDDDVSFNEAIERVKDSTEDMNLYTAVTLEKALGASRGMYKINIQYIDDSFDNLLDSTSPDNEPRFTFRPQRVASGRPSVISIDMQIEFFKLSQALEFRVEYDKSLYSEKAIIDLFESYIRFTNLIASNPAEPVVKFNNLI